MAHALGVDRSQMLLSWIDQQTPNNFEGLVARRRTHEPVAYITGEAYFFGRKFSVDSSVLIPRGDSECLVAAAIEVAPQKGCILDLGTGSGALILSLLAELPGMTGVGLDVSRSALSVARRNSDELDLSNRVEFSQVDWHNQNWPAGLGRFELIISNPPYIEEGAKLPIDVKDFEPATALFGGKDGLENYRAILPRLSNLLNEGGVVLMEIGHQQAQEVAEIGMDNGFVSDLRYDLAGRPRVLILR